MEHSVKWMTDNLGITCDMLRYYESKKLIERNPNGGYRDYTDEEIERIWGIKLLIGIRFTANEIYAMMHDPNFDFYEAMTAKVADLEIKQKDATTCLEVAKSIKFIGRVPVVSRMGSVRFDDFMEHVRQNFNLYSKPQAAPYMELVDSFVKSEPENLTSEQLERVYELFSDVAMEDMQHTFMLSGYF